MTPHELIKNIRYQLLMQQDEFAKKLGVTKAAICNYERGVRFPKMSVLKRLKELALKNKLNIQMDDFFK